MEILEPVFFYSLATILCLGAVCMIFSRKVVTSLIWAMLVFSAVAGVYFMMNATFNAVIQIAVFVAMVPAILLMTTIVAPQKETEGWINFRPRIFMGLISLFFVFVAILWALVDNYLERILDIIAGGYSLNRSVSSVYTIGERIFSNYVVGFEILAILGFVLVVGIGMIGVFKRNGEK